MAWPTRLSICARCLKHAVHRMKSAESVSSVTLICHCEFKTALQQMTTVTLAQKPCDWPLFDNKVPISPHASLRLLCFAAKLLTVAVKNVERRSAFDEVATRVQLHLLSIY